MNIKLGKVLYIIRKESNLSQRDVAKIINCSRGTYSCWERDDGEIPLSKLLQLLNSYNIPITTFIKRAREQEQLTQFILHETDLSESLDVKAELDFICERIMIINQSLVL